MAALSKVPDLLTDIRAAMLGVPNVTNVYTYERSLGNSQSAFRAAFQEPHETRFQGWVVHKTGTDDSSSQDMSTRSVYHTIELIGWHTYDHDDPAEEERITNLAAEVLYRLARRSYLPSMDYMEPGMWPEMDGPEVVRIKKTRLYQVTLKCYPAVVMAIN